jgi:hypothetical protein
VFWTALIPIKKRHQKHALPVTRKQVSDFLTQTIRNKLKVGFENNLSPKNKYSAKRVERVHRLIEQGVEKTMRDWAKTNGPNNTLMELGRISDIAYLMQGLEKKPELIRVWYSNGHRPELLNGSDRYAEKQGWSYEKATRYSHCHEITIHIGKNPMKNDSNRFSLPIGGLGSIKIRLTESVNDQTKASLVTTDIKSTILSPHRWIKSAVAREAIRNNTSKATSVPKSFEKSFRVNANESMVVKSKWDPGFKRYNYDYEFRKNDGSLNTWRDAHSVRIQSPGRLKQFLDKVDNYANSNTKVESYGVHNRGLRAAAQNSAN